MNIRDAFRVAHANVAASIKKGKLGPTCSNGLGLANRQVKLFDVERNDLEAFKIITGVVKALDTSNDVGSVICYADGTGNYRLCFNRNVYSKRIGKPLGARCDCTGGRGRLVVLIYSC